MKSVGIREMKQNPQRIIQQVLDSGEALEITSYGRPTGVRIVPDQAHPQRWVPAETLASITPLSSQDTQEWKAALDQLEGDVDDPWDGHR